MSLAHLFRKSATPFLRLFNNLRYSTCKKLLPLLPASSQKIYDCFLFNNELSLLGLRLAELIEDVDYFVICECPISFSGSPKPLHYHENKHLFREYHAKIIHYVIPEPPLNAYTINPINPGKEICQFWQRNQILKAIEGSNPNDLIMVSDVDEIPKPKIIRSLAKLCRWSNRVIYLSQFWHLLFLNIRVISRESRVFATNSLQDNPENRYWIGTFACTKRCLKDKYLNNINGIWSRKWGSHRLIDPIYHDAGWHFSYIGGINQLLAKIRDNGMPGYSQQTIADLKEGRFLECRLEFTKIDNSFPLAIQRNQEAWQYLLARQDSFHDLAQQLKSLL